jgi:purine-nucleoside phosphorylase
VRQDNSRDLSAALSVLSDKLNGFTPKIAMILGSGLGFLADMVEDAVAVPYGDIPDMPVSTAPGHAGRFVFGKLRGQNVAVMQGRIHGYEGYTPREQVFGLRLMILLGAGALIVTNACGGVREDLEPGCIVALTDHIKLSPDSPLIGPNDSSLGVRFPDMSRVYTPRLRELAKEKAAALGIPISEGVYMFFAGPQYETPAEIRAARALGADVVGMSTVYEVIAAGHAGLEVLGLSLVCNKAAGMVSGHTLTEQEVLDSAEAARPKFSALVLACLGGIYP